MSTTTLKHPKEYYKTKKFIWRQRIGFGISEYACNLAYLLVNTYLMFYYTNIAGLNAKHVATMFIVSKVIDAVTDYSVGAWTDRTNTKIGRYRPWLLAGAPVLAIGMVLLFTVPLGWGASAKMAWAFISYAIFAFGYTMVSIPLLPMMTVLSEDTDERAVLGTSRACFSLFGSLTSSVFVLPMIYFFAGSKTATGGQLAHGYLMTNVVLGVVVFLIILCSVLNTEEINPPVINKSGKTNVAKDLKEALTNKYFIMLLLNLFSLMLGYLGMYAAIQYYYTYIIKSNSALSLALTLLTLLGIPFMYVGLFMAKKGFPKGKILVLGNAFKLAGFIIIFVGGNVVAATVGVVLIGIGCGFISNMMYAVFSDVSDYAELRSKGVITGTLTAIYCLVGKIASALANAVVGYLLAWGAYDSGVLDSALEAGKNLAAEYPRMILSIKLAFGGLGIVTAIVCIVVMLCYDLDKKYPKIKKELDEFRASEAAKDAE